MLFLRSAILTLFLLAEAGVLGQIDQSTSIIYHPIGIFHSEYNTSTGAPRQGILIPESTGWIEIFPEYKSALKTLELFEYIYIIYHFNEVTSWNSIVEPPGSNHKHEFGLFSTRSPKRPNAIGLSLVKLEKISDGNLFISGVDAFEGTPVLDIKPYLPSVDEVKSIQNELIEKLLGHHDELFIDDSTFYK